MCEGVYDLEEKQENNHQKNIFRKGVKEPESAAARTDPRRLVTITARGRLQGVVAAG